MGDDHHRAGIVLQEALQPGDRLGIEMVGRLVEQQQVGTLQQQPAQRHAAALTAGQRPGIGITGRAAQRVHGDLDGPLKLPAIGSVDLLLQLALLLQQRRHLVIVERLGEAGADLVEAVEQGLGGRQSEQHVVHHRQRRVELWLLRQVTHLGAFRRPRLTGKVAVEAGHDLQQRRLAGTVDADDADLGAGQKGKGDSLEHLAAAGIGPRQPLHHVDVLIRRHCSGPRVMPGGWRRQVSSPPPMLPQPEADRR